MVQSKRDIDADNTLKNYDRLSKMEVGPRGVTLDYTVVHEIERKIL